MTSIPSYPKILALGTKHIVDIWNGDNILIEEKLDGSQIGFGVIGNELCIRSKNVQMDINNPDKMFYNGIEYIKSIRHKLDKYPNTIFYAEYMQNPKHHTIAYDRIPTNHLMLFGIRQLVTNEFYSWRTELETWAEYLNIEPAPLIYSTNTKLDMEQLNILLEKTSKFGGSKIEGFVVKNYDKEYFIGGHFVPFMAGKYVSERFKEVHNKEWRIKHTSKGQLETFFDQFRTEARWEKAVLHLKERGELEEDPRDIGKLFKEVNQDVEEEEQERVKEGLWNIFKKDLLKTSTRGLAEWYKEKLFKGDTIDSN